MRCGRATSSDPPEQSSAVTERGFDAVFVVRGAEERAVRRGLSRAGAAKAIAVYAIGIGPAAAQAAVEAVLDASPAPARALVTGLCGALSAALEIGDALFYSTILDPDGASVATDAELTARLLDTVDAAQSGIRALTSRVVVISAADKSELARRYDVDAVDMETLVLARRLTEAGSAVAALRVVSDCVDDDLPDLNAAVGADGALSGVKLFERSLERPGPAVRMARNGSRALAALERAIAVVARAR
jgi:nucleoside phosphorylase